MTKICLTLVLLCSVTNAQTTEAARPPQQSASAESGRAVRTTWTFEYDALRQGSQQNSQIMFYTIGPRSIVAPGTKDLRVSPTDLQLQLPSGFHVSAVRYPVAIKQRFVFDPKPVRVMGLFGRLLFKVGADSDVRPGNYRLHAALNLQPVDDAGIYLPQHLEIDIPIKVVDRNAKVQYSDRSIAGLSGKQRGEMALLVLLAPVLIPLSVLMSLTGKYQC